MNTIAANHPANLYGHGYHEIMRVVRGTQPLPELQRKARKERGRHGKGMVYFDIGTRNARTFDVEFYDRCHGDPATVARAAVHCFSSSAFCGEHKPTCVFGERYARYIAWLRKRLGMPNPS